MNNWNNDIEIESYIRQYFTIPFYCNTLGLPYEVVYDKQRQLQGIDIICNGYNIDEKCSTYRFVNKKYPPSWLAEIAVPTRKNKSILTPGWSIQNNSTDYLLLMSISSYIGYTNQTGGILPVKSIAVPFGINELICILEDKNACIDFICNKAKLNKQDLFEIAIFMNNSNKIYNYQIFDDINIKKVTSNTEQAYVIPLKFKYHREIAKSIFRINRYRGVINA